MRSVLAKGWDNALQALALARACLLQRRGKRPRVRSVHRVRRGEQDGDAGLEAAGDPASVREGEYNAADGSALTMQLLASLHARRRHPRGWGRLPSTSGAYERRGHGFAVSPATQSTLPLEQLAAILAAEQDGFAIDEILAVEGVSEEDWQEARERLLPAIVDDVDAHARYQRALIDAQDRLACPVSPLYEDMRAWVAFLHVAEGVPLQDLLDDHGLTANDVARLQRHWRDRFAGDPSLARQAGRLRKAEPPPELGILQVGERELTPSPYAAGTKDQSDAGDAGVEEQSTQEPPTSEVVDVAIGQMARLYTALEAGESLDEIVGQYGLGDVRAAQSSVAAWKKQLEADGALRADFMALVNHERRRRELSRAAERGTAAPSGRAAGSPLPARTPPSSQASRVADHRQQPSVPSAPPGDEPAGPPSAASVDETAAIDLSVLSFPLLPFAAAPPRPTVDETCSPDGAVLALPVLPFGDDLADEAGASDDLDGTSAVIPALRALPPTPWADDPEDDAAEQSEPHQSEVEPPLATEETAFIQALPAAPPLPFASADDPPAASAIESADHDVDPGAPSESSEADDCEAAQALSAPLPNLTIEQYASYCVERELYPEHRRVISSRYRVQSEEQHEQVAAHWTRRLTESAADRQRWQHACACYREHLFRSRSADDESP